jgi:hypothetical protein
MTENRIYLENENEKVFFELAFNPWVTVLQFL